jgi:hypothetical protein
LLLPIFDIASLKNQRDVVARMNVLTFIATRLRQLTQTAAADAATNIDTKTNGENKSDASLNATRSRLVNELRSLVPSMRRVFEFGVESTSAPPLDFAAYLTFKWLALAFADTKATQQGNTIIRSGGAFYQYI